MELAIHLEGAQQIQAMLAQYPAIIEKHLEAATEEALMLLQREIAERTPLGANQLLRGSIAGKDAIAVTMIPNGLLGVIGTSNDYAIPVELGTKPHFPWDKDNDCLPETLVDWVIAKLPVGQAVSIKTGKPLKAKSTRKAAEDVAWLVARKISQKGTEGAFMFRDGFAATEPYIQGLYKQAMNNALAEIKGLS